VTHQIPVSRPYKYHSEGSAVSTWTILPSGGLKPLQNFTFVLDGPGTVPARQDAPHPHEAVLDPTDSFIVVPDLGADLLRIFTIDKATSLLTESTAVQVTPGAGPRHGAFLATAKTTYFFLVDELDNQVRSFKVTYIMDLIIFDEMFEASTFGTVTPPGAAASEAHVTASSLHPVLLYHDTNKTRTMENISLPHRATLLYLIFQTLIPQTAPRSPLTHCKAGLSTLSREVSHSNSLRQQAARTRVSFLSIKMEH